MNLNIWKHIFIGSFFMWVVSLKALYQYIKIILRIIGYYVNDKEKVL